MAARAASDTAGLSRRIPGSSLDVASQGGVVVAELGLEVGSEVGSEVEVEVGVGVVVGGLTEVTWM